jgi:hypothetical protein
MKGFLSLVVHSLTLTVFASTPRLLERQGLSQPQLQTTCLTQYTVEYGIAPSVIGQPVEIVTSFAANTTLVLAPYNMPITISNAPMVLSTVVTAYSTVTNTLIRRYVTLTSFYTGQVVTTQTMADPTNMDATTTFMVLMPSQDGSIAMNSRSLLSSVATPNSPLSEVPILQFTTVTSTYSGSVVATSTAAVPSLPGQIGTVIVQVPASLALPLQYTTVTSLYAGSVIATSTAAVPSLPGQIGTVVVQVPASLALPLQYTTVTST